MCTQTVIMATTFCSTCKSVTDNKGVITADQIVSPSDRGLSCKDANAHRYYVIIYTFPVLLLFFTPKGVTGLNINCDIGQNNGTYIDVSGESASSVLTV